MSKNSNTTNHGNQLNSSHAAYHSSRGASPSTAANNASQAGTAASQGSN